MNFDSSQHPKVKGFKELVRSTLIDILWILTSLLYTENWGFYYLWAFFCEFLYSHLLLLVKKLYFKPQVGSYSLYSFYPYSIRKPKSSIVSNHYLMKFGAREKKKKTITISSELFICVPLSPSLGHCACLISSDFPLDKSNISLCLKYNSLNIWWLHEQITK